MTKLERLPVKVLLVEDNPTSRLIVQRLLERLGCEVDTAEDGETALTLIGRNHHELVILDQQLPLLNGYEIVERIRSGQLGEAVAQVTLFMISGELPDTARQTWLSERRVTYLTKPITLASLTTLIDDFYRKSD